MTTLQQQADRPQQEAAGVVVQRLGTLSRRDYAVRFAFGAAVSAVAAVVGLVGGHRMGGLFLAFPAILPAALTLLEKKDGVSQAASDVRGATIGAVAMIAFALVAAVLLPRVPAAALPVALITWVVATLGVYLLVRLVVQTLGERQYLPEIPADEAAPAISVLRDRNLRIALAESCTGGLVTALLTNVPGAGDVVAGGIVSYAEDAKTGVLRVEPDLIRERTAVSAAVAREMALNAKRLLHADVGLSVTGLLGTARDGEAGGLTYIALATPDDRVLIRTCRDDQGPGRNRERDVRMALRLVVEGLSAER